MIIYPAIDLYQGKCVRLKQGKFDSATTYSDDPLQMINVFAESGACHLHVVDLDGAKDTSKRQTSSLKNLIRSTSLKVQVGGGLRTRDQVKELLELGAERVVIGSAAVSNPQFLNETLLEFGGSRITLALDVRPQSENRYYVATEGWSSQSQLTINTVLRPLIEKGIERVLCTDISRDGMLQGPNLSLYDSLVKSFPELDFQASGGITTLDDLLSLKRNAVRSVVIGKAIYTGSISLSEAILKC